MKVAVAAATDLGTDSMVDEHFGSAPFFVLVTVDGEEMGDATVVLNPYKLEHMPGQVPEFVHNQGADAVIAQSLGPRAVASFKSMDVEVYVGAEGTVEQAVKEMLQGNLEKADPQKDYSAHHHGEHEHGHGHGHHH